MAKERNRPDKDGPFRRAFESNKKKIFATQNTCAICGKPVDFSLKFPDPLSPTIDHIIPIEKGGHPSDMSNLQLAHFCCNRAKYTKLGKELKTPTTTYGSDVISNRVLPQTLNWSKYREQ